MKFDLESMLTLQINWSSARRLLAEYEGYSLSITSHKYQSYCFTMELQSYGLVTHEPSEKTISVGELGDSTFLEKFTKAIAEIEMEVKLEALTQKKEQ